MIINKEMRFDFFTKNYYKNGRDFLKESVNFFKKKLISHDSRPLLQISKNLAKIIVIFRI